MGLTLTIENETSLPDGGPLSVRVNGKRGLDIGRDQHLDWTLPDSSRSISGKHCEIRYRDGGYWIVDLSTNGTFLNGSDGRLKEPHRLRDGDRLTIGHYIISCTLDGEDRAAARENASPAKMPAYHELWTATDNIAPPPIDARLLRPPSEQGPIRPDFLDWAVDVPEPSDFQRRARVPPPIDDDAIWARGPVRQMPSAAPAPSIPAPRRPVWVSSEPSGPWGASPPSESVVAAVGFQPDAVAIVAPAMGEADTRPDSRGQGGDATEFVQRFAAAAGIPAQALTQDADRLAEQLGGLVRLVTDNMRQLLVARLQAKRLARMSNQTTIEAVNNNPLKFSPTSEDALRIMFGAPTTSYLDASRALEEAFSDLKQHQIQTYAAMQQALAMMVADLDPQAIDQATEPDRGLAGVVGSRKARLWDAYVASWQAKARGQENGIVDVFMQYFAECYGRGSTDRLR